jgi:hypothetical protein
MKCAMMEVDNARLLAQVADLESKLRDKSILISLKDEAIDVLRQSVKGSADDHHSQHQSYHLSQQRSKRSWADQMSDCSAAESSGSRKKPKVVKPKKKEPLERFKDNFPTSTLELLNKFPARPAVDLTPHDPLFIGAVVSAVHYKIVRQLAEQLMGMKGVSYDSPDLPPCGKCSSLCKQYSCAPAKDLAMGHPKKLCPFGETEEFDFTRVREYVEARYGGEGFQGERDIKGLKERAIHNYKKK